MLKWVIRFLCVAACCVVLMGRSIAAHPLSFTEAWITVSDRIEVKLRIFTDDIVRYELGDQPLPETIATADFNNLLKRQTLALPEQLHVYVDGHMIKGRVVSEPAPWTGAEDIDVTGTANVKHAWTLDFPLSGRTARSLTLRHSFSPPGLQQPGELRLHSRHIEWKQRIDSVIPPNLYFTLVFSPEGGSATATEKANEVVSRIIVSPFAITHELTIPVEKALSVFPSSTSRDVNTAGTIDSPADNPTIENSPVLTVQQQHRLGKDIEDWLAQNTTVFFDEFSLTMQTEPISQYFESGIIPEQPIRESRPDKVTIPGTLIGIRRTFALPDNRRNRTSGEGRFVISSPLPGISRFRCETIAGDSATTSIPSMAASSLDNVTLHTWTTARLNAQSEGSLALTPIVSQDLIATRTFATEGTRWILLLLGLVITVMPWVRKALQSSRKPPSGRTAFPTIGSILVLLSFALGSVKSHEPRNTNIQDWTACALQQIYLSVEAPTEQQAIDRLGQWLEEDLVETLWLSLCRQMTADSGQQTWTAINSVNLHESAFSKANQADSLEVDCHWEISGMAYHWGHAHRVTRRFSGVFLLSKASSKWKIEKLDQLSAESATTEAS